VFDLHTLLLGVSALAFLLGTVLIKAAQDWLRARIKVALTRHQTLAKEDLQKARSQNAAKSRVSGTRESTDPTSVVLDNFDILGKYYEQTLDENRLLSRSAIGVALFGFLIIIIGVGLAFSGFVSVGLVSSVAGLLAEAGTVLFFNQLREQVRQVQEYHRKLVSTQYLMTSISLSEKLSAERRETEISKIISNLLFLSNELHGSKSDHLFPPATVDQIPLPPPQPAPLVEHLKPARSAPAA
jgi:hypothetical protein